MPLRNYILKSILPSASIDSETSFSDSPLTSSSSPPLPSGSFNAVLFCSV